MGFFSKLAESLKKTKNKIADTFARVFSIDRIGEDFYDELTDALITSDISVNTAMDTVDALREEMISGSVKDKDFVVKKLKEILTEKVKFNLSEQIRNCVLLLEKKWSKKRINLCLDFDEIYVQANEDMLKQVWINLLDNAIKFSNSGGDLLINISKTSENISVGIQNDGIEIPESEYDKIFNKFYRVEGQIKREGNGIGLSIVKHIVELHGGKVSVKSEHGKTEFTVTLVC